MTKKEAQKRLEYLRGEIEAERISYGEIAELQSLTEYIEPGDVILLEWAGVPENQEFNRTHTKKEILEARQAVIDANNMNAIIVKNIETLEVREMTIEEVLEEINRDRSGGWTDYDRTDWKEGLEEWTDWRVC